MAKLSILRNLVLTDEALERSTRGQPLDANTVRKDAALGLVLLVVLRNKVLNEYEPEKFTQFYVIFVIYD